MKKILSFIFFVSCLCSGAAWADESECKLQDPCPNHGEKTPTICWRGVRLGDKSFECKDGCKNKIIAVRGGHNVHARGNYVSDDFVHIYSCTTGWSEAPADILPEGTTGTEIGILEDGTKVYCSGSVGNMHDVAYCNSSVFIEPRSANGADSNANSDLLAQEKGTKTQVQDRTDPAADKQQAGTDKKYSGYVYGRTDDDVIELSGASVRSETDPGKNCWTNNNGFFNDCVLPSNKVIVSYGGYSEQNVDLNGNANKIVLEPIDAPKAEDPKANANQDPSAKKTECPQNQYWNDTLNACVLLCPHLRNGGKVDGIKDDQLKKREACCKIPADLAKWEGDLATGSCKCITEGANLEDRCKVPEEQVVEANANGGAAVVASDSATGDKQAVSLCTKAGGYLKGNTCVCGEGQNATYSDGQCVCTNEVEDWDITNKNCVVNDIKKQEKACNTLGSKANWEHEKCICTNDTEDYKYDASTGTGECVENQERKNKKDCEKLGTRIAKWDNGECVCIDESNKYNPETKKCEIDEEKAKAKRLADKQDAYDAAKETEQSLENRMLGGLTTAATGLGGMQLAQGLSEKKADKAAEADMAAYMATFRCTYGNGQSVRGGVTPIELPGGNDTEMMQLRNEYFALAQSLKERKESLGMKPGIESEEILDKTQMGLYDAENTGITGGNYASLYRAQMGNTNDQEKIDTDKDKSDKRVKIGGTVAGIGVAGGILGNSIINGKLGDMIKDNKTKKAKSREEKAIIEKLKSGLSETGMTNVDKLDFSKVDLTGLKIDEIDFTQIRGNYDGKDATKIINTSNASSFSSSFEKLFR